MLQCTISRTAGGRAGTCQARHPSGFTLIEIIVVVVILAIAAAMVVPMMSSGSATKTLAAAQMVAADLEYAKSMAVSRGRPYGVTFDADAERYQVEEGNQVTHIWTVIDHPVNKGFDYVTNFNEGRLDGVQIVSTDFDGTNQVRFDHLGSPHDGDDNPLNSGVITLRADSFTQTIRVTPVTGVITIE